MTIDIEYVSIEVIMQSFRPKILKSFIEKRFEIPIVSIAIGTIRAARETVKSVSKIL